MKNLKKYLSKLIREFNYDSLKWHWDDEWYPNGYGGDYQIQLYSQDLEYLNETNSGNKYLEYLARKVRKLSNRRCYLATNQGYMHSSLDIVAL